ncbi:MAG: hypothetical protein KDE54_22985 [Caldilineaceae bacterium]|nr:hypothetical protein [Caldilineaceae bacterium]MCB0139830.1 hypothetical protein [Caldilineaceae bacterium]
MLTAIRDFAADAFGNNEDERLDEIQYGEHQILIETAQHVYIAVVADGIEPAGFRNALRRQVIDIQHHHYQLLADYNGDASHFAEIGQQLSHQLMRVGRSKPNARSSHSQIKPDNQRVEIEETAHKPYRVPVLIEFMRGKRKTGPR